MNKQKFDYDEFEDDKEIDEELDGVLRAIGEELERRDGATQVVVPKQIRNVLCVYKMMKQLTEGTKAKVTYQLHEPHKDMGSVTVANRSIYFTNPEQFMKVMEFASSFSVSPMIDGTVEITFGFKGLTKIVEE